MSHRRPPLMRALQLNTGVMVVEIAAGIGASSFSLIMDGIHNLSDEVALLLLVLAYGLRTGLSGGLLRFANLFNSVGLLFICGFLIWRVVERLSSPMEVSGVVPIVAGLIGAAGNWAVAKVLRGPSKEDVAIRLAYVHNLGDDLGLAHSGRRWSPDLCVWKFCFRFAFRLTDSRRSHCNDISSRHWLSQRTPLAGKRFLRPLGTEQGI